LWEEKPSSCGLFPLESIVNRWIVDYYVLRALESFRKDQYEDFCNARDILQKVLQRAVERTNVTEPKIRVLQFLTRINEGENLELSFERDKSITPLESALVMLENWKECNFVQADLGFEKVYTSVKEMVSILIYLFTHVSILLSLSNFFLLRCSIHHSYMLPLMKLKQIIFFRLCFFCVCVCVCVLRSLGF
uniref:Telomere repeat-binding factor dimerisation domain-containing protein n=1 Tax=Anabas testudineus TaxID=64144 RepID=A0A3Q1J983_ANATE